MFRKTSPICQCHLHSLKKCWKVHIRVLALLIPPWIVNSKKILKNLKNMVAKNDKCSKCLPSFIRERHSWKSWQKKNLFWSADFFFLLRHPRLLSTDETWQALKKFVILWHQIIFEFFWTFLDFTNNGGSIRAKTRMGTFQHFFHECKWHWHIGDVFLNILVSYLHFSDLVWISYEVFKVTVKGQKHKRIKLTWIEPVTFGN